MKKTIPVSVAVVFDDKKRVLLTKRHDPKNKDWHKKWQFPGGEVEYGEHPQNTIHREIEEETGIKIKIITNQPIIHSVVFEDEKAHIILFVFVAKYVSGVLNTKNDPETSAAIWFFEDEIDYSKCFTEVKEIYKTAKRYII